MVPSPHHDDARLAPPVSPPDDEPALPAVTSDERDTGWEDEDSRRDAEWYQRERPPHHG